MASSSGVKDSICKTSEYVQDAGQHEPLTTRLKNILQEYKDGLTIIKELLQNAEDAEATEFNILYDSRTHPSDQLFFPGMAEAHGPALVVHNSAKFSEADFENITKLAGATKKDQHQKIGKFGIGFCSVYHLTDVPSFVSDEWFHIFDPAFLHLKKEIDDHNQPGKKLNYLEVFASESSEQMVPYEGLFGFDITKHYDGTMFRFPFRKKPSAISDTSYESKRQVDQTICHLKDGVFREGAQLMLFLKYVKKITFQTMSDSDKKPSIHLTLSVSDAENCFRTINLYDHQVGTTTSETWLISKITEDVVDGSRQNLGLRIASVATKLSYHEETRQFKCESIHGEAFCFLPLNKGTGLPVHISANFAVMSNRADIWISNSVNFSDKKEIWNMELMKSAIPNAYLCLLDKLKKLNDLKRLVEYDFTSLLPLSCDLINKCPWEQMVDKFYSKLLDKKLLRACNHHLWCTPMESLLASCEKLLDQTPECIFNALLLFKDPVVVIKSDFIDQMKKSRSNNRRFNNRRSRHAQQHKLKELDNKRFIEMFFESISRFSEHIDLRNEVLFHIFQYIPLTLDLLEILKSHKCIPCQPDGKNLKYATDIIDPHNPLVELLGTDYELLPIRKFAESTKVHYVMSNLGLLKEHLPLDATIECAKLIESYPEGKDASSRIAKLMKCISNTPDSFFNDGSLSARFYQSTKRDCQSMLQELKSIEFVPVLSKPSDYCTILWKADLDKCCRSSMLKVFFPSAGRRDHLLLGSQKYFVDVHLIERNTFGFHNYTGNKRWWEKLQVECTPMIDDVLKHFSLFLDCVDSLDMDEKFIHESMIYIYTYFNETLKNDQYDQIQKEIKKAFASKPSIYISGKVFITPECIAKHWRNKNGPYLFTLPVILAGQSKLIELLNIPDTFSADMLLSTLQTVYKKNKCEECVHVIEAVINEFKLKDVCEFENLQKKCIVLPDNDDMLHPIEELVINDIDSWLPIHEGHTEMNKKIRSEIALALGVKRLDRKMFLSKFSAEINVQEYGQSEELTRRIESILHDYPLDETLLIEMLQNADDAKATNMYVILDKRTHGFEKVPSPGWKHLQGPALLIWNNGEFKEEDIQGLQNLGLGSKRCNRDSIGQFGIGFNVAYHITDCPSFSVKGETLCVLDPHYSYIDGTSYKNRGMRFNNLPNNFWNTMSDLANAYLLSDKDIHEIKCGTLFRLPLRQSVFQGKNSETVQFADVITCNAIERKLEKWIPLMKDALLFLQYVREFSYFIIEQDKDYCMKLTYKVSANFKKCSKYSEQSRDSLSMDLYNLTLKTVDHFNKQKKIVNNEWLVQHGKGLLNNQQEFKLNLPPKHGIAAPIWVEKSTSPVKGQLFCCLPLPIYTALPVHLSAQFVLGTNRRALWSGDSKDERSMWNTALFNTLGYCYAIFVENARHFMINDVYPSEELCIQDFVADTESYFDLYPFQFQADSGETVLPSNFVKSVFSHLWQNNAKIMSSRSLNSDNTFSVVWHTLQNEGKQAKVFFRPDPNEKCIVPILEKIGMILSEAPLSLYDRLVKHNPLVVNPTTVFNYFCKNYSSILGGKYPCHVSKTSFETSECFCKFISYMLKLDEKHHHYKFPESRSAPFGYPFLLTADNKIRIFDPYEKVLQSDFSFVFAKSLEHFLHKLMCNLQLDPSYFLQASDICSSFIEKLLKQNFAGINKDLMTKDTLENIWKCFSSEEKLFSKEIISEVLYKWAFIPAENGKLYNTKNSVRPLVPQNKNSRHFKVFDFLIRYHFPVLDKMFFESYPLITEYCLDVSKDPESILLALHDMQIKEKIFGQLQSDNSDLKIIVDYLSRISYRNKTQNHNLMQLKALPIFETMTGDLVNLQNKGVYQWPDNFITSGCGIWMTSENVFLKPDGDWSMVCDVALLGKPIDPKDVFTRFVFPNFSNLDDQQRKELLQFIKEQLFYHALIDAKKKRSTAAEKFINNLKKLPCLKYEDALYPISEFCDHSLPIFNIIPENFAFVPEEYRQHDEQEDWLDFFRHLELQTELTFNNYVYLAQSVLQGEIKVSANTAANILLTYLFSEKGRKWLDDVQRAREIAKIEYIPAIKLKFSIPALDLSNREKPFVCLSGAAITDFCQHLIWTINPIINLPKPADIDHEQFSRYLKTLEVVIAPSASDVYQNLCNIAQSDLSRFDLFYKYSIDHDIDKMLIVTIIKSLVFLQKEKATQYLEKLSCKTCIPVPASEHCHKSVLVQPIQVVRKMTCEESKHFHPYISTRPKYLSEIDFILFMIGVEEKVNLVHMELILTKIHAITANKPQLDPNQVCAVRNAILKLGKILKVHHYIHEAELDVVKQTTPLYLSVLNVSKWQLRKSDEIMYADILRYSQIDFVSCSVFKIPKDDITGSVVSKPNKLGVLSSFTNNVVTELDICSGLASSRCPKKLSLVCHEVLVLPNYDEREKGSTNPLFLHMNRFMKHKYSQKLEQILPSIIHASIGSNNAVEHFTLAVSSIVNNLSFVVVNNLNVKLVYNENNRTMLTFQPNLHLQLNRSGCERPERHKLYISKHCNARPAVLFDLAESFH